MSNILEYTLSLQDKISAKLKQIGINNDMTLDKFAALQNQSKKVTDSFAKMGTSIGTLKQKLDLLQAEKEWIPSKNIDDIRKYNSEIKKLTSEIGRLETANGSKFKKNLSQAFNNIPGADLITNPIVATGAAFFAASKMGLSFGENMAKINTTAQLTTPELNKLGDQLLTMGKNAGADLNQVPLAYEKILSTLNDVDLSTQVLEQSLKGSKAGFTDVEVVADALSTTLGIVGKENISAAQVMDTLFAAKKVGKGEFKDFATYIPQVTASAANLGMTFNDVAGTFAYMSSKSATASQATTLLENAFTALSKIDVQEGLKNQKIDIFDENHNLKSIDQIMLMIGDKMRGLNDQGKLNFLDAIGLKDSQAKTAFQTLMADNEGLKNSLLATKDAAGEADKAFKNAQNPMMSIQKVWSQIQYIGIKLGGVVSTVLEPIFNILSITIGGITDTFGWLIAKFNEGNNIITFLGITIGVLTGFFLLNMLITKSALLWDGLYAAGKFLLTGAITLFTGAMEGANAVMMLNPIGLIILLVIALAAAIGYVAYRFSGWGDLWDHTVKAMKYQWEAFKDQFIVAWLYVRNNFLDGIDIIKRGWYEFKKLIGDDTAQTALDSLNNKADERKKELAESYAEYSKNIASSNVEANLAANSLKDSGKSFTEFVKEGVAKGKEKLNGIIGAPKAVGDNMPKIKNTTGGGSKDFNGNNIARNASVKKAEGIATGGTKNTTINIRIGNLVDKLSISSNSNKFQDSAVQITQQIEDALVRALASAAATAG